MDPGKEVVLQGCPPVQSPGGWRAIGRLPVSQGGRWWGAVALLAAPLGPGSQLPGTLETPGFPASTTGKGARGSPG
jgi:hypothetical protein